MLNRIRVKNFKSFKDLDYSCAKLNLLMGVNGAGKSSFVQLLSLLKGMSTRRLSDASVSVEIGSFGTIADLADLKYCYANEADDIRVEVDFTDRELETVNEGGSCAANTHAVEGLSAAGEKWNGMAKKGTFSFAIKPDTSNSFKVMDLKANCSLHETEGMLNRVFRNFQMVSTFRMKPCKVHNSKYVEGRLDPEGADVAEYLSKMGQKFFLCRENPMRRTKSSTLIDEVNAWLGEVSPGAEIKVEIVDVLDMQKFVESVSYGDGELQRTFDPKNVGFGVSYILPVLVTLLTAYPGDIIIIENPEAHLHPRGQAEMGNLIARAAAYGVQLFVETHSDHLIDGLRVAVKKSIIKSEDVNIAFFERKGHDVIMEDGTMNREYYAHVHNITIDKNGGLSDYPEDFLDEWNKQTMELMKPRGWEEKP